MRDKNQSLIQFRAEVSKFISKRSTRRTSSLRTAVANSSTFLSGETVWNFPRRYKEILGLSVVQWFVPEILHWKLYPDLWEKNYKWLNRKQRIILRIILESENACIKFLYETQGFSSHEIFGNILDSGCEYLENLKFHHRKTQVVYPQRKRGYDDKGSLGSESSRLEKFDWTFDRAQEQEERSNLLMQKTINRILKYFENLQ